MSETEIWRFETASFVVRCLVHPEDLDPADLLNFPEDIEAARSGTLDWFRVEMRIETTEGLFLGSDHLGGCAYRNASDFAQGKDRDGYFRSMVREAILDARRNANKAHLLKSAA